MYYEIYIDVIFLVNMLMNFLLLFIVKKILKVSSSKFRLIAGSCIGSLGVCILVLLPGIHPLISFLLKYVLISFFMISIGLRLRKIKELLKSMLILYLVTFIFGGILEFLYNQTALGWFYHTHLLENTKLGVGFRSFLIIVLLAFIVMNLGIKAYEYYKVVLRHVYPVTIIYKGKPMKISGFLDTGNSLTDPITKKPVSIINIQNMEELLEDEMKEYIMNFYSGFHNKSNNDYRYAELIKLIPYHSIGKKHGILPAIILDKICVAVDGRLIVVERPVLGICEDSIGVNGFYQMILNPELVN